MTPLGPAALILLVIPAIALRIALRALYGKQRLASADPMQMLLSHASMILFILAGLGVGAGMFGFWALLVLLPVIVPMLITRIRQSQHRALVWALAAAAQRGIPLSEAARAYADETLGDTGLRSLALAESLERGEPLSNAVRASRLWMGSAVKLAVRLGERLGVLGPAMRQQLDDSQQIDAAVRDLIGRFSYLCIIAMVMTAVTTFVMLRIVPVLQRMFEEFGLKLPAMTALVIEISRWYVEFGWWATAPLVMMAPLLLLAGFLYCAGWLPRDLPLVWRLFRRYDGALVMRGLSLSIRRGLPLPQALRLISECYPISIVARRLRRAADRVAEGANWQDSLKQAGLIGQADVAVLGAAERVGNLDWALEEMADSAIRRQLYRAQAVLQFLFPLAMIVYGIVVGIFVIGCFIPIVSLIQGLA